jgi:hypothetical protein
MALLFVPKCVLVVQKALKKQPTSLLVTICGCNGFDGTGPPVKRKTLPIHKTWATPAAAKATRSWMRPPWEIKNKPTSTRSRANNRRYQ